MLKRIFIIIIILVVGAGVYFLIHGDYGFSETNFTLRDTLSVSSFSIEGRGKVELTRTEGKWQVNSMLDANPTAVSNFLYCMTSLEIDGMQSDYSDLEASAVRVNIETGGRVMRLRYYHNEKADFLHHEGSDKVYRVRIKSSPNTRLEEVFSQDQGKLLRHCQLQHIH